MRRMLAGSVVCLCLAVALPSAAQTPAEMAKTAALIESWQNPDGGYGASPGAKSSLGATSSAVRMLKNVGGAIRDAAGVRAYVASCIDPKTGGFANEPGGTPGVALTASGLMAVGELGSASEEVIAKAVDYLAREAKTFEDLRIAVAGMEAVGKKPPDVLGWAARVEEGRKLDGTWGDPVARARATGSRLVALLRIGVPVDEPDKAIAALKADQRPDGGWSPDGTASNLETTYRVMRGFFMLKKTPDLDALRAYLASHRRPDGSYASKPGADDSGGTYFVTTVQRWVRLLSGEPAVVETAGFTPLFDGKSLDGWEGDTSLWAAENGSIIANSRGLDHNEFLATTKSYDDFILKFTFRISGDPNANSGAQFRSVRIPGTEMSGYQADIGQGFWGCLYDESRRNTVLVPASDKARAAIRPDAWNFYEIRCMGDKITLSLNGETSVVYTEKDPGIARGGKIALQAHAGKAMRVEFKDIYIQPLPIPPADDLDTPGFHRRTLKGTDRQYAVFLPDGFDPARTYPTILFLHGSGERGADGIRQAQAGIGPILAKSPAAYPAIVVLPQARQGWGADSEDVAQALAALDEVKGRYKVDAKRTYLTGLSMGGAGAWGLAAKHPEMFAAVVPVCGFGDVAWAESLKALPIWTFLGDADMPRIVNGTRDLVRAVSAAGGKPGWTEYRGVGHNSWDRTYSDPKLPEWMLSHSR